MSSRSRSPPHNRYSSEIRSSERDSRLSPPSRILYIKDIPADIETKEIEELFKKYNGYIAIRRVFLFI